MHKDPLKYAFNPAVRSDNREEGFSDIGKLWMPVFYEYAMYDSTGQILDRTTVHKNSC